jgi:hypothetical protein
MVGGRRIVHAHVAAIFERRDEHSDCGGGGICYANGIGGAGGGGGQARGETEPEVEGS